MRITRNPGWNAGGIVVLMGLVAAGVSATAVPAAGQTGSQGQVTFTKDVAPILQRTCQTCHRPNGGMAPMALTTYEEVRPWAKAIKQRTAAREMPPWFIEKNVGIQKFKDDISLSDEELATIAAWVDSGAPKGNPADMPPPRVFAPSNAWTLGEPDLIVSSPLMTVKAEAGDFHDTSVGVTPTGLTEDRFIKSMEVREFRPGEVTRTPGRNDGGNNLLVVHHAGIGAKQPGEDTAAGQGGDGGGADAQASRDTFSFLYEVGQNGLIYPADLGVRIQAGADIAFSGIHLHSIGKEVKVNLQVGFKFHPKGFVPKYRHGLTYVFALAGFGEEIDIPGNTDNVRIDKFATLSKPTRIVTFEPHLHASGKRMCMEATYPNGNRETLNCAGYNHAWVKSYAYDDDVAPLLPAGTVLRLTGWYDNTAKNPRVVDPRNWKGLGHRSIDDMFISLGKVISLTDEEYQAEVAAREAKQRQTITAGAARNSGN